MLVYPQKKRNTAFYVLVSNTTVISQLQYVEYTKPSSSMVIWDLFHSRVSTKTLFGTFNIETKEFVLLTKITSDFFGVKNLDMCNRPMKTGTPHADFFMSQEDNSMNLQEKIL